MKMPNQMAPWKRVLAFIGFTAGSFLIVYSVLHSETLDCAPENGAMSCVFLEQRAWVTTDEARFAPPTRDRVTVRRYGKGHNRGEVKITTDIGRTVEMTWMSADEASDVASALVTETSAGRPYRVETHGPRWWLLLLLLTVPVAVSFVIPQRLKIQTPEQLATLAPPVQDKKLKRAERKAHEHEQRK